MKRILVLFALVGALPLAAQSTWFCPDSVGKTLTYATYNQNGAITNYSVVKVTDVIRDGGSSYVTESSTLLNVNKSPVSNAQLLTTIRITDDTTYYSINRQTKMFGALATTSGVVIELPAVPTVNIDWQPGRTLTCNVNFAGIKINTTTAVSDYRLVSVEPFDVVGQSRTAYKVSYETVTRAAGRNYLTTVEEWYVHGLGVVNTVVTNQNSGQSTVTKLISVK